MPEKTPAVKNVIYLIPDGGGYALYDFADMVKKNGGFDTEKYPNKTPTNTDELTMKSYLAGSMKTSPYTGGITDSAAAGTAMATGHKTINGYLGIDYRGRPKANLVEANVLAGTTYKGVYFRQTADLDMAGFPGYHGLGSASTFSGIYNGNGHTINLAINSDADQCLFPYTDGIIMNLGTTGSVSASTYAAGICRSIRQGGALINCWSTATLTGSNTGGIVWSNYGTVANCYFGGTISKSGISYEVTQTMSTGVTFNTFYVGTDYIYQKDVTEITDTQLKEGLVSWLNTSREKSAGLAGCLLSDIMMWVTVDGQGPRLRMPANEEGALIATALSDIEYKDGCITGIITLEQCPSDYTAYIALYDHNSLLAVEQKHITDGTKAETFEILYSISDDVSYTLKLLLWDKELTPCALPASASF